MIRRIAASALLTLMATGCVATVANHMTEDEQPVCWAPWEVEPYKSGRAIPAPGPDAIIPTCEYSK